MDVDKLGGEVRVRSVGNRPQLYVHLTNHGDVLLEGRARVHEDVVALLDLRLVEGARGQQVVDAAHAAAFGGDRIAWVVDKAVGARAGDAFPAGVLASAHERTVTRRV